MSTDKKAGNDSIQVDKKSNKENDGNTSKSKKAAHKTNPVKKEEVTLEQVHDIIARMKYACNSKNDFQLCMALDLSRSAVNGWQKRLNIPHVACFRCSDVTGYNVRWLVTGKGPVMTTDEHSSPMINNEDMQAQLLDALADCEKLGIVKYGLSSPAEARALLVNRFLENISAVEAQRKQEMKQKLAEQVQILKKVADMSFEA